MKVMIFFLPYIIKDGFCGGNLNINDGCVLQQDLTVGGSLYINKGDFHLTIFHHVNIVIRS